MSTQGALLAMRLLLRLDRLRDGLIDGNADREDGAAAVGSIGGHDGAAMGFDESPADGQPQSRAGALAVAVMHPIELVEDALEIARRDPGPLVAHLDDDLRTFAPAGNFDRRAGRRILARVVQ